jgi:hypothetical protein
VREKKGAGYDGRKDRENPRAKITNNAFRQRRREDLLPASRECDRQEENAREWSACR